MRIQYLIIAAIFLVNLVGCGGSSGNNSGSSGGGGVTFPPNVPGQALGSRNARAA